MVHIVWPQVMVPDEFPYFLPTLEAPGCLGMSSTLCLSIDFMDLVIEGDLVNLERRDEGAFDLKFFIIFVFSVIIVTQINNWGTLDHLVVNRVERLFESIRFILGHDLNTHHVSQGCPRDTAHLDAPISDVLHCLGHAAQIDRQ